MANVDDQALAVEDRIVVARPLIDVLGAHGAQMHVADLAAGFRVHLEAAGVFPLCVAQIGLIGGLDGRHQHIASFSRSRPHAQQYLRTSLAAQQRTFVGNTQGTLAVDADDDLPILDPRLGTIHRRGVIGQIRIVQVHMFHHKAARLFIALQQRAQRRQVDLIGRFACIAASNEDVQRGQLADHLRDHLVQLLPVRYPIHQRQIALTHGVPVDALHVAIVEIIAFQAPRVQKYAAEFRARIGEERPVALN